MLDCCYCLTLKIPVSHKHLYMNWSLMSKHLVVDLANLKCMWMESLIIASYCIEHIIITIWPRLSLALFSGCHASLACRLQASEIVSRIMKLTSYFCLVVATELLTSTAVFAEGRPVHTVRLWSREIIALHDSCVELSCHKCIVANYSLMVVHSYAASCILAKHFLNPTI